MDYTKDYDVNLEPIRTDPRGFPDALLNPARKATLIHLKNAGDWQLALSNSTTKTFTPWNTRLNQGRRLK